GAEIWVDGFAGFTAQEYELIAGLAQRAARVEITMLANPDASALTARELPAVNFSLFARTERTIVRLRDALSTAGVRIDESVRLRETHFAAPALRQLEARLFREDDAAAS